MTPIDYAIFIAYLIGTLAIGFVFFSRNKTSSDMFAAGGHSPWWVSGLSGFMTLKSAGTFVVWGGLAYQMGVVAIAIVTCIGLSGLLVGRFVAGYWRRLGISTPAEFIEFRFGPSAVQFYTWSMMAIRTLSSGVALYAVAVMLVTLIPLPEGNPLRDPVTGNLSLTVAIIAFAAIIIVYTVSGGLWAVLMTDILQFVVLQLAVLFIIPLLFFALKDAPQVTLPTGFFVPFSEQYTLWFLAGWVLVHFFVIGAEWAFAQRFLCVPTERDARWAAYLFGGLYLISPTIWLMPSLMYRMIDPSANPEQAYILASQFVLPTGMLGLMMAALFSATASAISGQINVFAGVFSEQFYRRLFAPAATDKQMVWAGRVSMFLLGLLLLGVALAVPLMGGAQQIVLTLTGLLLGPLLAPTVFGLVSKRIGLRDVFITAGTSFAVGVFLKFGLKAFGGPFMPAAEWVRLNPRMVDVLVGAVLPTIILSLAHFTRKSTSAGWAETQRRYDTYTPSQASTAGEGSAATTVTWISLGATGLVVLSLIFINSTDQVALAIFGLILMALSIAIWARARKTRPLAA
ncbi:sodium:solute symporter family transporter [Brevundimonas aurifodinae]|uniref:Na+:solute symporter n=1 Tax=Brevundimonas aurifodinae TaxID=1508312 RepID=A0ABV1NND3_9CAUL